MKKLAMALIPLSLMTMGCAFAGEEVAGGCCPEPCCPPPCCTPCCVPQPRKCIDCECYNPQYYNLQCAWGVFVTVDFLYWYAKESKLDYCYTEVNAKQPASVNFPQNWYDVTKHHYVSTEWNPGVRVGLGMNMGSDGWDLFLNWTYFHNHAKSSVNNPLFVDPSTGLANNGNAIVINPWTFSDTPHPNLTFFSSVPRVEGKWSCNFNQIDCELGRKFWVSRSMTLRPYCALRGAWVHTNFDVLDAHNEPLVDAGGGFSQGPFEINNSCFIKNKYWGVGLVAGLQPEFMLGNWCGCGLFSIYANVDAALLWGKFNARKTSVLQTTFAQTGAQTGITFVDRRSRPVETDHYSRLQGILDVGLGLRWEEHWCCDRYSTSIDLGWEHHYWINYGCYHRPGTFARFEGNIIAGEIFYLPTFIDQITTDLGFGGLVVRLRLDF